VNLDCPSLADGVDLLVGLALQIDLRPLALEQAGDVGDHFALARAQRGALADDGDVDVADPPARLSNQIPGRGEEARRVGSLPLRIVVGELLADVRQTDGPEERIGDRVEDGVAVAVPHRSGGMVETDAAENERPTRSCRRPRFEAMEVVAMTHAKGWRTHGGNVPPRAQVAPGGRRRRWVEPAPASRVARDGAAEYLLALIAPVATREARPPMITLMTMTKSIRPSHGSSCGLLALALTACLVGGGCYSPKGGLMPSSFGAWTYQATETRGKTFALIDLRSNQPLFVQAIPAGQQLTVQFLEGGGDDPVRRPDRMVYELQPIGTSTGRLTNQVTVPPSAARRIDISVTSERRYREEPADMMYRTDTAEQRPDFFSERGGPRPDSKRPMYDG